ncbi:MAG: glycosyl transferase [Gammaproteobacteria bacterium]
MEHYVTLFDSVFLPQGLALHESLTRHGGAFTLWVLCMDERAKVVLDALNKPNIRTIALADVETPELLAVKPGRSRAEYCWTLTPFTPTIVFLRDSAVKRVTYVDADVFILRSPGPVFDEFEASGKAVLITDHAYDPEYDQSAASGQYCVQFVTFVRDLSEPVRKWWQDRCIEWCFNRIEDGKCGDQKYLDVWPEQFGPLVHVLQRLNSFLAPWNARRFPYSHAIAWHFHGLRLLKGNKVLLHGPPYVVPEVVLDMIYGPYVAALQRGLDVIGEPIVQGRATSSSVALLKKSLRALRRVLRPAVRPLPKGQQ